MKKISLVLLIPLLILLLGCACPECPPCPKPEVFIEAPNVTVEMECPESEITVEVDIPKIEVPDVEVNVEFPDDLEVTVNLWWSDYNSPRYKDKEDVFRVVVQNHLWEIDYYPTRLKVVNATYKGSGLWILKCKFQSSSGGAFWREWVFSEWSDKFVE